MDVIEIIKQNPSINITINGNDLMRFGENLADKAVEKALAVDRERLFTRKEVIEKFNVCSATLWKWGKLGIIKSRKVGNRVYYSESDLNKLLTK